MKFILFLFLCSILMACGAIHSKQKSIAPVFSTEKGALRGYDPVAYFTDGQAVEGQPAISYVWNDATWHFASPEHRSMFQQNPEKYAPAYGGYCAYGWSQGYPAPVDPAAWSIVDSTLYLNYNADVRADWDKKRPEYILAADRKWKEAQPQPAKKN